MSTKLFQAFGLAALATTLSLAACASPAAKATTTAQAEKVQEVAMLEAQADQTASNKQVVQTFLGHVMAGNWDAFDRVIATDCVLHEPGGVDIVGLEAMKAL